MTPARQRLIAAAVLVISLSAIALVLMLHRAAVPGRALASVPARAPSTSTGPAPQAPSARPGPVVSLAGLRWSDFYGVSLPVSAAAGPRDTRKGLASGYADTPAGAVLAAVNIAVRATPQGGPRIFTPTISRQVTGPDAPALLESCTAAYNQAISVSGARYGQPLGPAYVAEQAFRLASWSPAQATVDIASAGPGPQGVTVRAATRVQVEWLRGDWRVIAPPGGNWAASATALPSLAGFSLFPTTSGG